MAKLLVIALEIFDLALGGSLRRENNKAFDHPTIIESRAISQSLNVNNPYYDADHGAGEWGGIAVCSNNSFATAVEVKYRAPSLDHSDETAINVVRLYCNSADGHNDGYVESAVGTEGEYQGMRICSSGFITGFYANTLEYQGELIDDLAVEDFIASCDYGKENLTTIDPDLKMQLKPYGFKTGEWSTLAQCDQGSAVCGIEARFEDASLRDATAVCEVVLFCCKLPATNGTLFEG